MSATPARAVTIADLPERVAVLEHRVGELENDTKEIKADVKTMLAMMNQAQGGWKVAAFLGPVLGAVVAKVATKMGIL